MSASKSSRYEARARIMRALGNPNRLMLLEELSGGEKCVAELTEAVGLDVSTVSKHLSLLKAVGLVRDQRRGVQVYYQLLAPCVLGFFDCMQTVMDAQVQRQLDLAK